MLLRDTIYSSNYGGMLTCVGRSFAVGTTVADIDAGAAADVDYLTTDGRSMLDGWHDGESDDANAVYFEKHYADGRVTHGWIDATSRKIVQVG